LRNALAAITSRSGPDARTFRASPQLRLRACRQFENLPLAEITACPEYSRSIPNFAPEGFAQCVPIQSGDGHNTHAKNKKGTRNFLYTWQIALGDSDDASGRVKVENSLILSRTRRRIDEMNIDIRLFHEVAARVRCFAFGQRSRRSRNPAVSTNRNGTPSIDKTLSRWSRESSPVHHARSHGRARARIQQ
jgi:hypothetical protein